ncbi:hypothetical protein [Burkholderia pseudomallei]|uniref:hypothetical protein n=1 Tax=Burkholderia pseudomallei TaxID=28450 RepID=UPI000162B049|nr:hypothetical protein [Burkholderia pseudomallei]ABY40548.1 hypothetical protein 3.12 [Burkholderia phage Bups phi1]KGS05475.1 hypothetical protein X977_800 [Burkholderia pseudomallei MSHR7504]KGV80075.1 hypothetical protein X887_5758 [Burkholderia pseudomallei MSHR4375]AHE31123.1 hypothetical protein BBJ_5448 [Burkholderia pseudomallei NCTC 13178]KGC66619.1 hypothetical protein DP57_2402 [Burkholderia pseudomallei]
MFVQFSDADEKVITAVFANEQDREVFPNQGKIDLTDPRYAAFFNALPRLAQQAIPSPVAD